MGVDATLYLPWDVRSDDAREAIAVLAGHKPTKHFLGDSHPGAWAVRVKGCTMHAIPELPNCLTFSVQAPDKALPCIGNLHWGWEASSFAPTIDGLPPLGRYMMARSRPVILALFDGLARLFGDAVDFNDHDSIDVDVSYAPQGRNNAEDGDEWQAHQERIFNLAPITRDQLAAFDEANYEDYEVAGRELRSLVGGP